MNKKLLDIWHTVIHGNHDEKLEAVGTIENLDVRLVFIEYVTTLDNINFSRNDERKREMYERIAEHYELYIMTYLDDKKIK